MLFLVAGGVQTTLQAQNITPEERTLLRVIVGIHYTFANYADSIWPGYDLSRQPYLAYLPNEFVLFINPPHVPPGFEPYPSSWPGLNTRALIHFGTYRDLRGQFAFNFQIDSVSTFAMGLPEDLLFSFAKPSYMLFSSTIHEGFHQYQYDYFGEIPWAREELYPILDVTNSALAALEMHILKAAVTAMSHRDDHRLKTLAEEFVAVREYRWQHGDNFIARYEQGQEINEGTARYVEKKAVACFLRLDTTRINNPLLRELRREMADLTVNSLLLDDLDARLQGLAVSPADMLRNRIYPVGATLGFMLDELKIPWKLEFQKAGEQISFLGLLKTHLNLDNQKLKLLFNKAKVDFNYPAVKNSARQLIDAYLQEFHQALDDFNKQSGIRIELDLSANGLQRFRSTRDKRWVVDRGQRILCRYYNLYTLKTLTSPEIQLNIRDKGLLELNNWQTKRKVVIFFSDKLLQILLNDKPVVFQSGINRSFKTLNIKGENFNIISNKPGRLIYKKGRLKIKLI